MYQPYPSSGQPAEPLRPPAPAPVLTAVKLMYAGAAVSAVELIIGLALIIVDIKAAARGQFLGHSLAAPSETAHHHGVDSLRPGRDRPVAVDGAGERPGPELGAHPVHGAVRPGDAAAVAATSRSR